MSLHINTLTIDATQTPESGCLPGSRVGLACDPPDDEQALIAPARDPSELAGAMAVLFHRNPDAKTIKNRRHFDLVPVDQPAEVQRLEALGAHRVEIGQRDVSRVVMADPEGNELCESAASPADNT